jgi:hypothetical protein
MQKKLRLTPVNTVANRLLLILLLVGGKQFVKVVIRRAKMLDI